MRVVLLTGSEPRHVYVRKATALTSGIEVRRSYCEGTERSLTNTVGNDGDGSALRKAHAAARDRSERDFFLAVNRLTPDAGNPVTIPKGTINDAPHLEEIQRLAPDLLVAYGCSLLGAPFIEAFPKRILNVHLGLSPYYRGAGTNFWPLVHGKPEYVGATFMYLDAGVDTGEIIHQIRAHVHPADSPHHLGNRLIRDVGLVYPEIIKRLPSLPAMPQPSEPEHSHVFRIRDFTESAVSDLHCSFTAESMATFIESAEQRQRAAPIVVNPQVPSIPEILGS